MASDPRAERIAEIRVEYSAHVYRLQRVKPAQSWRTTQIRYLWGCIGTLLHQLAAQEAEIATLKARLTAQEAHS